jgi:hypothetical protein
VDIRLHGSVRRILIIFDTLFVELRRNIMSTHDDLYVSLDRSIWAIAARWKIYNQLFNSGEENVALLNSSGSYVFFLLQRLLLDDTILALSRLTDRAFSGKDQKMENASIFHLIQLALPSLAPADCDYIKNSVATLEGHVKKVRTHRDKAIAHADLSHALGLATLPDIEYSELEAAMQELENLMLKLGTSSTRRVGDYGEPIIAFGADANVLLARLRQASPPLA